jgi:hypothetical protein
MVPTKTSTTPIRPGTMIAEVSRPGLNSTSGVGSPGRPRSSVTTDRAENKSAPSTST